MLRQPVVWSERLTLSLKAVRDGLTSGLSNLDTTLAGALIACTEADFGTAESALLDVLNSTSDAEILDGENFISLINAAFTVQRTDIFAALLADRHEYNGEFTCEFTEEYPESRVIKWRTDGPGRHHFAFSSAALRSDATRIVALGFHWEFPLFVHYNNSHRQIPGELIFNHFDAGLRPGLAYCDNRPNYFLIPDCLYMSTEGYRNDREIYLQNAPRWPDRANLAFWRGSTTGRPARHNDWQSLPRVKLAAYAQQRSDLGLFDVGLSSISQIDDASQVTDIEASGLILGSVHYTRWSDYKYQIDIDGNTNAWSGLFYRLLSGSAVLKVESNEGYCQWYYDRLKAWKNYVPVSASLDDLVDKLRWLQNHDEFAERVGAEGRRLAESVSYRNEMERSVEVINGAFLAASVPGALSSPFGWRTR